MEEYLSQFLWWRVWSVVCFSFLSRTRLSLHTNDFHTWMIREGFSVMCVHLQHNTFVTFLVWNYGGLQALSDSEDKVWRVHSERSQEELWFSQGTHALLPKGGPPHRWVHVSADQVLLPQLQRWDVKTRKHAWICVAGKNVWDGHLSDVFGSFSYRKNVC